MDIKQLKRPLEAFQQPVNEAELKTALSQHLAPQTVLKVSELEAGLFNNTYRVDTDAQSYILKIAPTSTADVYYNEQHLMPREQSLQYTLSAVSELIPTYKAFFKIGDRNAFLQSFVSGRLWFSEIDNLSELENNTLWQQLGTFAKTMHTTSGDEFGYPSPFTGFASWSEFIKDNVQGMVRDCKRLGAMCEEIDTYLTFLPQCYGALDSVKTAKLCHGDLWPRNVIYAGEGTDIHIKAVFDCERAFWGDPISDWVLILYGVPDAFWQGYGENLRDNSDPVCVNIYQGMYFILNILEAKRFNEPDEAPRGWLAGANAQLDKLLK